MGSLITALVLAASLVQPHAAAPGRDAAGAAVTPETLYQQPSGAIQAFAQDGSLLTWFSASTTACNAVWVLSLDIGARVRLPAEDATAHNVTCRWDVAPPVRLAIAGRDVLWALRDQQATIPFDYILGAGVSDPRERRFQQVAHAKRGAGLWLEGIAGDSVRSGTQTVVTLAYATAGVEYVDELGCLSGGSCQLKLAGGGVYRVVGRKQPTLVPNTQAAVALAVSGGTLAYVPAATVGAHGSPVAAADLPMEIVDAGTGASVAHVSPQGTPVAIALAPHVLATLERTSTGMVLAWYSATTGSGIGSVSVPADTAPEVSANDQVAVFRIGHFVHVLTFATGHSRTVAETVGTPIGLSLEGSRLAWAENVRGRGRIRGLTVNGSG